MTFSTLAYALVGGILPACAWLYLLLKEDSRCPEPRRLIALAFIAGMCAVPLAILPEELAHQVLNGKTLTFISWAAIEELLKFGMAAVFILWRPAVDEAPDYVLYMMTVALGFAAAENTLYILNPFLQGHFLNGASIDEFRFIGSTLLHVVASATVGFSLALAHRFHAFIRVAIVTLGLILAISLHTTFNLLIIYGNGKSTMDSMFLVWTLMVAIFAGFEVLKYYQYRNLPPNTC